MMNAVHSNYFYLVRAIGAVRHLKGLFFVIPLLLCIGVFLASEISHADEPKKRVGTKERLASVFPVRQEKAHVRCGPKSTERKQTRREKRLAIIRENLQDWDTYLRLPKVLPLLSEELQRESRRLNELLREGRKFFVQSKRLKYKGMDRREWNNWIGWNLKRQSERAKNLRMTQIKLKEAKERIRQRERIDKANWKKRGLYTGGWVYELIHAEPTLASGGDTEITFGPYPSSSSKFKPKN